MEKTLAKAVGNPVEALAFLDKLAAEESLLKYIQLLWPVLEPGRRFIHGWAVEAICEHLEYVTQGHLRKLLINVPPGCMKSLTTNVFWPTWEWGPKNMPHLRYISTAYSENLSIRDNRRSRQLIQSEIYQRHWLERFRLMSDQNAKVRFDTDSMGFRIATSVGGVSTGERGDRIIVDDPHNVKDTESTPIREATLQWFSEVLPTRTNDPETAVFVVIMQRVHEGDVSGMILSQELGYEHLCLPMEYEAKNRCFTSVPRRDGTPAETVTRLKKESDPIPVWLTPTELEEEGILPEGYVPHWQTLYPQDRRTEEGQLLWPERFSERHLEEDLKPSLRAWGGTYAEAGQLQQRPAPRGGGMFERDKAVLVDELPAGSTRWAWVRGYDLAGTKDGHAAYTASAKLALHDGLVWVADVRRARLGPKAVEDLVIRTAALDGVHCEIDLPQDPGQAGKFQKSYLVGLLVGFKAFSSPESGSKEDRARPFAAQWEAGNVRLVRAPWNDAFLSELALFPSGRFKDQVDAISRAFMRAASRRRRRVSTGGVRVVG